MRENLFGSEDGDLVLRDDQAEFFIVLDETARRRNLGARLRLIDSGAFSVVELERLGAAGADLFTSDKAGRTPADLFILNRAAKRGGGRLVYFHHGPLEAKAGDSAAPSSALAEAVRDGMALFLSNRETARSAADLSVLAEESRRGGNLLGYYHHGPLFPGLFELARRGAWIHFAAAPEKENDDVPVLIAIAAEAATAGGGMIIHVERPYSESAFEDLLAAGAAVLFRTPPSDYRSPIRRIEETAARRRLDPRAYYLYSDFMR